MKNFPKSKLEAIIYVHDPKNNKEVRLNQIDRMYDFLYYRTVYQTKEQQMYRYEKRN